MSTKTILILAAAAAAYLYYRSKHAAPLASPNALQTFKNWMNGLTGSNLDSSTDYVAGDGGQADVTMQMQPTGDDSTASAQLA